MGWYYIIRIVLVFDGFYNYYFEPRQKMRNSLFVFGLQFSQCPKKLIKHWAEKSHLCIGEIPNNKALNPGRH
jgi:hypothetical protein